VFSTARWFFLYSGSIQASGKLYKGLLRAVLFADMKFHDTVSRGRLLNRFGKDFEGVFNLSYYVEQLAQYMIRH
jgi:ABC-type multidrug transport system fused ATPase/permease subunit